jgi:periplasmic divalent cation tolerance protein
MDATAWVQVTTTTASEDEAAAIADHVLAERLAACVQTLGPVRSRYWWHGRLEQATEWLCICKTTAERAEALIRAIEDRHSFDTPEVLATPVTAGSPGYLAWVAEEVRPPGTQTGS